MATKPPMARCCTCRCRADRFARRKTDRKIAQEIGGAERQVTAQRQTLPRKLQVQSEAQLAEAADRFAFLTVQIDERAVRAAAEAHRRPFVSISILILIRILLRTDHLAVAVVVATIVAVVAISTIRAGRSGCSDGRGAVAPTWAVISTTIAGITRDWPTGATCYRTARTTCYRTTRYRM
jgi:hypothetical protein